jgi:hypothetical protein
MRPTAIWSTWISRRSCVGKPI